MFDLYYERLCARAAYLLDGDMALVEEIVQQVLVDFWCAKKWRMVKTNLFAFLATSVKNKATDYNRSAVTRRRNEAGGAEAVADTESSDPASNAELKQVLHAAIRELPEQCRNIFTAVYLEGKKYPEAAELYGVSINTVKIQLRRAMEKLRSKLKDFNPLFSLLVTLFTLLNRLMP